MKKTLFTLLFAAGFISLSSAQVKVIKMEIDGDTYNVCRQCLDFPKEIFGKYLYEGKGEPIVELGENFEGVFQTHGMPANAIEFWIDCDENGKVKKKEWVAGGYQTAILVHYKTHREGYKSDYDILEVTTRPDLGEIQVLRERTKPLPVK